VTKPKVRRANSGVGIQLADANPVLCEERTGELRARVLLIDLSMSAMAILQQLSS
jgi:hypothetical protein